MKYFAVLIGLLSLPFVGATNYEENRAEYYVYKEYFPSDMPRKFEVVKDINNFNTEGYYCGGVNGGLDSITKPAQKICDAITDRYNEKKLQLAKAEIKAEIGYLTGNEWMGINSDNQMYAQLHSYAKKLAPYDLCGFKSLKTYEVNFISYMKINDNYKKAFIRKYGSIDKASKILYEQQEYLLEREKARMVNSGISSDMCKNLKN